jgi:hypothetical protein
MADYPDWTDLVQIIGADIMVPIDMQGAYIMMPVDIQAQYVTLSIDITAQSVGDITVDIAAQSIGNIAVNIAASAVTLNVAIQSSAVTLNVDITAQTLGDITISIDAQTVGVYLNPDWQVKAGNGKVLVVDSTNKTFGQNDYTSYTVPAGKTYYITDLSLGAHAYGVDDAVYPQVCDVYLYNQTDGVAVGRVGGYGGGSVSFPSPRIITTGKELRLYVVSHTYAACTMHGVCGGYVI